MKVRLGVQAKILAILLLMVFATAATLAVVNVRQAYSTVDQKKRDTENAVVDKSVVVARTVSAGIVSENQLYDFAFLKQVLSSNADLQQGRILGFAVHAPDSNSFSGYSKIATVGTNAGPSTTEDVQAAQAGHESVSYQYYGNVPLAAILIPFKVGDKSAFITANISLRQEFEQAGKDRDRAISDTIRNTMIVSLVATVVATFLGYLLSRSIVKPVKELTNVAEKVSMGEMNVEVSRVSNDEIGDLADSFSRMVTAVKFYKLESDVQGGGP